MEFIINTVMIVCFILALFFLVAKLTGGSKVFAVIARFFGLVGTLFPMIYFLKYFGVI